MVEMIGVGGEGGFGRGLSDLDEVRCRGYRM